MTFLTQDSSVHDSLPIECYRFTGPLKTYYYNDSDEDVTISDQVFISSAITRDAIEAGVSIGNPQRVNISVPFDTEVAVDHGYLSSPSYLNVDIFRVERGTNYDTDNRKIWTARAKGFSISGLMLEIATQAVITNSRSAQLLSAYWQRTCNFDLYDSNTCKVNKADHTTTSTVTVVGPNAVTVVDDGLDDHELAIGTLVNNRTGETRLITDNLANVINVSYGFSDVVVGDTVTISRGCKHNTDDCLNTFDNIINYGGFKFIPKTSPLGE